MARPEGSAVALLKLLILAFEHSGPRDQVAQCNDDGIRPTPGNAGAPKVHSVGPVIRRYRTVPQHFHGSLL